MRQRADRIAQQRSGLREVRQRPRHQTECFAAGVQLARCEGIVPAPESTHAVKAAIDEALRCKAEGRSETILFNLSGHGHFDMQAYTDYFAGKLQDVSFEQSELDEALSQLPAVAATV